MSLMQLFLLRPILNSQLGNSAKIAQIARQQSCLLGQCDRGDLEIHRAKPATGTPKLRQSLRSHFVEIENRDLCEKGKQLVKLTIACDFLMNVFRAPDHCQPAAHLLLDVYDSCANLAKRHTRESSGQDEKTRWTLALDNRQMVGIQNNHYRLRPASERRYAFPALMVSSKSGSFLNLPASRSHHGSWDACRATLNSARILRSCRSRTVTRRSSCVAVDGMRLPLSRKEYNKFAASVAAFQNLGLELFKQDKVAGYVEGGRKPAFAQGAETVGVFIKAESSGRTKVLIDNNQALAGVMFAVDWTENLFQQIGTELSKRPPPKIQ